MATSAYEHSTLLIEVKIKILNANEIKEIAGGINNPGYNHLDIAVKEGALTW